MEMIAGFRDLKNKLSHYLKKGRSIMITEREKIVATIVPAQELSKQVSETIVFLCFVGSFATAAAKEELRVCEVGRGIGGDGCHLGIG